MHNSILFAALDFRDPIWQFWVGCVSLVLSALAIIVTIVLTVRSRQRKLLTYEIVSNSSVINVENDVGEDLEILVEKQPVTKVRLHVIKLTNAGNTPIEESDYPQPLRFQFKDPFSPHPLIRCAISKTEPETLIPSDQLKNIVSLDLDNQTYITLKTPLLNPRDAILLRVILMARDRRSTQMDVFGQIKGGQIKVSAPSQKHVTWRTAIVGTLVAALALGFLINAISLIGSFTQNTCTFGSIQVSGSTSFYNTVVHEAQNYKASCPVSSISVDESSSGTGLSDLENGRLNIANSEIIAPASAGLQDHQVAVILFALIVNKDVDITNLTTIQIQAIYNGTDTNWQQVDTGKSGQSLPIKVIGRSSTSGTYQTFAKYILHNTSVNETALPPGASVVDRSAQVVSTVASTPGAIGYADLGDINNATATILEINQAAPTPGLVASGDYQFWAIEHMYTRANPDALSTSFIAYVMRDMQNNPTFIREDNLGPTILSSHAS